MANATFSSLPTDITPNASKAVLSDNYLNFHGSGGANWSQQYLPELYAQEVERYGNRSVSSFLRMVGAEMPMASDQVIWSEQGRLHLAYENASVTDAGVITIAGGGTHAVRVGQTIVLSDLQSSPTIIKCYVKAVASDNTTLTVLPYAGGATVGAVSGFDTATDSGSNKCSFFVYGSEFIKGSGPMSGSVTPNFSVLSNKPIILKDRFEISGSDTAQIGWVEVSGESGVGGYLWYLKAEGDTRMRFEDYLEMAMIEAVKGDSANTIDTDSAFVSVTGHGISDGDAVGSEGLFSAIESRGIVAADAFDAASDVISDFDLILKQLDKQGAIEENMLFLNRDANLILDDGLANVSAGSAGGTAFGVFENSEDMALNLGFRGFRRGSYDFYKTDWKYMNNPSARGLFSDIKGVLVPAGTSSVYDQQLGQNIRRPFLHIRYRASQADDRKMKSWITGSVGGATASGDDVMQINYLSERCLVVQAANNFVLFK